MKLYLSSAIVDTRLPNGELSGVSFDKCGDEQYLKLYYEGGNELLYASTDLETDKKALTKYFKAIEKQNLDSTTGSVANA